MSALSRYKDCGCCRSSNVIQGSLWADCTKQGIPLGWVLRYALERLLAAAHAVAAGAVDPSENKQMTTKRSRIFMMLSDVPATLN